MSQNCLHLVRPDWMSISFAKFSHNTSPIGARTFIWNHIGARNDLDFAISKVRPREERSENYEARSVMKITAGAELLEYQDLTELISFVREQDNSTVTEPPVQIVVKCPFLAMRFPRSTDSVRRIQLKFHNELDFGRAKAIFDELGLPVKNSGPALAANTRPIAPSPAPSVFSSTSTCSSATTVTPAPSSASAVKGNLDFGAMLCLHPANSTSYSWPPVGGQLTNKQYEKPNNAMTYPISHFAQSSTSLSLPASVSSGRHTTFYDRFKQSPSLYASQVEKESQSQRVSFPDVQLSDCPTDQTHLGASRFVQDMPPFARASTGHANSSIRQLSASPFFHPSYCSATSKLLDIERLTSTPTAHRDFYELSVPPRRILPFPKPRATSAVVLPSVSDIIPPPKPTPLHSTESNAGMPVKASETIATKSATQEAPKKRIARRKKAAAVTKETQDSLSPAEPSSLNVMKDHSVDDIVEEEPSPLAAKSVAFVRPPSTLGLQSKATTTKKRAAPASRPPSAVKKPKTVDQGTQTQTLSGRDHTTTGRSSPSEQAVEEEGSVSNIASEGYLDQLDVFVTQHKARAAPKELWECAKYAEADSEERQLLLNDFICDNLENEDFLLLCEDTEKAWRRIGLGM